MERLHPGKWEHHPMGTIARKAYEAPVTHHLVRASWGAKGWKRSLRQSETNLKSWLEGLPDASQMLFTQNACLLYRLNWGPIHLCSMISLDWLQRVYARSRGKCIMHVHTNLNSPFSRNFSLLNLSSAPIFIFQIKDCYKRKGRALHNNWGMGLRRHHDCKHICTQHRSTSMYKAAGNSHKRRKGQ